VALATPNLPWGVVRTGAEHRVVEFLESPPSPWPINAGVYLFSPSLLDLLPDEGDHERTTFPLLAVSGGLVAYQLSDGTSWRAVDTAKDLAAVAAELSSAAVPD
jgi:NDP-sugar pyrophosphorylase family protein